MRDTGYPRLRCTRLVAEGRAPDGRAEPHRGIRADHLSPRAERPLILHAALYNSLVVCYRKYQP
jgi:hypothetical protein